MSLRIRSNAQRAENQENAIGSKLANPVTKRTFGVLAHKKTSENVLPGKPSTNVVLKKGGTSTVSSLALRKDTAKVETKVSKPGITMKPLGVCVPVKKPLQPLGVKPLAMAKKTVVSKSFAMVRPSLRTSIAKPSAKGNGTSMLTQPKAHKLEGAAVVVVEDELCIPSDVEDIDKRDENCPVLLGMYCNQIYNYLRQLEAKWPVQPNYLDGQRLSGRMRAVLVDWLVDVLKQFHLLQETLFVTVAIIDRYLQVERNTSKSRLQLVGVAAMFLACKYEEMYIPCVTDFVYITDNTYTKEEIFNMEQTILRTLEYNLGRPIPLTFLRRYSKAARSMPIHHSMGKYILELSLIQYDMCHYAPSLLAAAAIFLAISLVDDEEDSLKVWTPTMAHYSSYCYLDIEPAVRKLAIMLLEAPSAKYQAVVNKYADKKHMMVSVNPLCSSLLLKKLAGES